MSGSGYCVGKLTWISRISCRDAVALAGGPTHAIPTGRRDGLVSNIADGILPDRLSPVPDKTMDPALAAQLLKTCAKSTATTFLDQNTSFTIDNQFFRQIMLQKGILKIDQELTLDKSSAPIVSSLAANENALQTEFANAMIKMASIDILVGKGEIRKKLWGL
ncbi:hypothetical protein HAX54_015946 [Datura stramonium]|uniref:peroxidase n=1 Tax=Datura stramonium TaxID=4076 RepID=A0ABS8UK17_DATST|nr:hypothetical protein [Datura stramonium]